MPKVRVTFDVADEDSDPADDTGLTNEAYERYLDALVHAGADDVDITSI